MNKDLRSFFLIVKDGLFITVPLALWVLVMFVYPPLAIGIFVVAAFILVSFIGGLARTDFMR